MGSVTVLGAGQQTKQHNNKDEREKILYTPIKTKCMYTTTTTTKTTHTHTTDETKLFKTDRYSK